MTHKIIAATATAVLLAGAITLYLLGHRHTLPQGVQVAGADVGGLTAEQAIAKLQPLLHRRQQPIRVQIAGKAHLIRPAQLQLEPDIRRLQDELRRLAGADSWITLGWRRLLGLRAPKRVVPRARYSKRKLRQVVNRLARRAYLPPRAAELIPSLTQPKIRPSRPGRKLDRRRLHDDLMQALRAFPEQPVSLQARLVEVRPRVDERAVRKQYRVFLTVDRRRFVLRLFKNLKPVKRYRVAVGQAGMETPVGMYRIQNKAINPAWHVPNRAWAGRLAGKVIPGGAPDNPLKARWLGIHDGVGIHGTADVGSLGSAASHGCIRMSVPDVVELYPQVPVGTPIFIQ